MGLSASQARLLSLTARQSNLEYEGQQINQQRTTLSNESSNYYNSLLEMSVPVPPSTNDYTKVVYTFQIGGNEATVKESLPQDDEIGNTTYLVKYTTTLSTIGIAENESYKTAANASKTTGKMAASTDTAGNYDSNKTYYLSTVNRVTNDEAISLMEDDQPIYVLCDAIGSANLVIGPNGYEIDPAVYSKLSDEDQKACRLYQTYDKTNADHAKSTKYALSYAKIPNQDTFIAQFEKYTGKDSKSYGDKVYEYDESGTDKGFFSYHASNMSDFTVVDPKYAESFINADLNIDDYYQYESSSGIRFVKREDVEGNLNNQTRSIATSAVATIEVIKENTLSNAHIEFDAQGRIANITDEEGHTYTMTATTETDNAAYDDAYNQYEYNQYVYDQRQNEINANIKILQAQDKSLELRLSTLDTQHSAIQTELEAVKKVMSKNIENSFKTFNA